MAAAITVEDVRKVIDTAIDDMTIQCMIDAINEADSCLDQNSVTDPAVKLLKSYAVAHQLQLIQGGSVSSRTAQEGAGISYSAPSGQGLESTTYGVLVKQMDRFGCITSLLDNSGSYLFAGSIGSGGRS